MLGVGDEWEKNENEGWVELQWGDGTTVLWVQIIKRCTALGAKGIPYQKDSGKLGV